MSGATIPRRSHTINIKVKHVLAPDRSRGRWLCRLRQKVGLFWAKPCIQCPIVSRCNFLGRMRNGSRHSAIYDGDKRLGTQNGTWFVDVSCPLGMAVVLPSVRCENNGILLLQDGVFLSPIDKRFQLSLDKQKKHNGHKNIGVKGY